MYLVVLLVRSRLTRMSIFFTALALLGSVTPCYATKVLPPLTSLGRPTGKATLSCEDLLGTNLEFKQPEINAFTRRDFSKEEILKYVDYLSSIGFVLSSPVLMHETITIRNILVKKFHAPMDGRNLYDEIRRHFSKVVTAVELTESGKKLLYSKNPARDTKSWDPALFIEIARQIEKLGMPFHEEFLDANSSLVGMMLAEVYGYPIQGEVILRRLHRAGKTIAEVRLEAGLPNQSPNLEKINKIQNLQWSKELLLEILSSLKERGFEINGRLMNENRAEIEDLIWKLFGRKIKTQGLIHQIKNFGGWVAVKKQIGYTYEGIKKNVPGYLDWTPERIIEIYRFSHALGYELHFEFFKNKEAFAPLRKKLEEKFGGYISGKILYERSLEIFGSFEEACRQAGVPYTIHNQTQLSTSWDTWDQNQQKYEISQLVLIEIYNFIHSNGVLPTKELLLDPVAYDEIRKRVAERFGYDISGETLYKLSLEYFDSHQEALEGAGILVPGNTLSLDEIKEAIGHIYFAFGRLTLEQVQSEYSDQIANLLTEKMHKSISGSALASAIRLQPATDRSRARIDLFFNEVIEQERARQDHEYESKAAGVEKLQDREFFMTVIRAVDAAGIPFTTNIIATINSTKIQQLLREKFELNLNGRDLSIAAKTIFGSLKAARLAAGLAKRQQRNYRQAKHGQSDLSLDKSVKDVTDKEIKIFLEAIYRKWPDIVTRRFFEAQFSREIRELLKESFSVDIAGSTLMKRIIERYGSLRKATSALDVKIPWGRSKTPSKEELLEVIRFIQNKGFWVNPKFLRDFEYEHPDLSRDLEKQFGYRITGIAIYYFSNKLFGQLETAVRAAGLDFKPVAMSEIMPSTKVTFTHEQLKAYLEAIFTDDPDLRFRNFYKEQTSQKIKQLLLQKFGVGYTGSIIQSRIEEEFGGLRKASTVLKLNLPWSRNNPPSKELLLEVIRFIAQKGFNITPKFLREYEYNNPELMAQLQDHFGIPIRGISIYTYSRFLFGQVENAVRAAGLQYKLVTGGDLIAAAAIQLSDEQMKHFVEAVFKRFPEIAFNRFLRSKESKRIHDFLKSEYDIDCTGSILYRRVIAKYGSLRNAAGVLGIKVPWGHSYTPTKQEIIAVLQFIHSKGYKINARFLESLEYKNPELMNAIEKEFGVRIRGVSVYRFSEKYYKRQALKNMLREAGINQESSD